MQRAGFATKRGWGRATLVRAASVAVFAVCLAVPALCGQEVVPVHEEPRHHLVLDRPDLRILDVQIPPGDTTMFHTHSDPIHYITIGTSRTTARVFGTAWPEVRPRPAGAGASRLGVAFWNLDYGDNPVTHQVANIGDSLFRLIAVVTRSGRPSGAEVSGPGTLEAESDWFERRRLTLEAGAAVVIPAQAAPAALIQVSSGAARLGARPGDDAGGSSSGPGHWLLLDAGDERVLENTSNEPVTIVIVHVLR